MKDNMLYRVCKALSEITNQECCSYGFDFECDFADDYVEKMEAVKEDNTHTSITEQLEAVKYEMCDKYCKWPEKPIPEGKTEDWLWLEDDSPCVNCPLNKL